MPLGSATYHFATLEELLMAGLCLQVPLTGGSYDEEYARTPPARLIP